jgi:hypothetical protein
MGIIKSHSSSLLDCDLNTSQIIFNNASTVGFDNTHNMGFSATLLVLSNSAVLGIVENHFWLSLESHFNYEITKGYDDT